MLNLKKTMSIVCTGSLAAMSLTIGACATDSSKPLADATTSGENEMDNSSSIPLRNIVTYQIEGGTREFSLEYGGSTRFELTNYGTNAVDWHIDCNYGSSLGWVTIFNSNWGHGSLGSGKSTTLGPVDLNSGSYRIKLSNSDGSFINATLRVNELDA